jgi:hypothetical protein
MNTLIGQFQKFSTRYFRDLKKSQSGDVESEEEGNEEGDETVCVMALYCIRCAIEACGEAVANLAKTYLLNLNLIFPLPQRIFSPYRNT